MSKFKVGDVVVCVDPVWDLRRGAEYTVTRAFGNGELNVRGGVYTYFESRFRLARRAALCADELELARLERDEARDRVQELERQVDDLPAAEYTESEWLAIERAYQRELAALEARLRHVQTQLQAAMDTCVLDTAFAPADGE